jgi:LEA14-like dessication related protein
MLLQATRSRLLLSIVLVASVATSLGGCSSRFSGDFRDPQVELVKAEVVRAKLLEQEFLLYFRVSNPNAVALPLSGLKYRVFLNEIKLAEGESRASFKVPANSERILKIPVHTNLWRHLKQVVRMLERPDQPIAYRFEGQVQVGGRFFGRNVQLSRNGTIIPGEYIPE